MKTFFTLLLSFFTFFAFAQVAHPTVLSLKGVGGSGTDGVASYVSKTSEGGFIIGIGTNSAHGSGNIDSFCTSSYTGYREFFLKYNADASSLEWTKCYSNNGDTSIGFLFPTSDGGNVLGGIYIPFAGGFYICKQDALGNIVWSHGYSKGNDIFLNGMITTDDGGYIMATSSNYTDTNVTIHYGAWSDADIFLMKLDSVGNKVWTKVIGGTAEELAYSIVKGPGDGCYVAGGTLSNDYDCTGNHGNADAYVARLDKQGNLLWHRDLGGTASDYSYNSVADGNGGIIISGYTASKDGDISHPIDTFENFWVINLDSNGTVMWNNCYGGAGVGYSLPRSICKATDGSIWIAGYFFRENGGKIDTAYGREDAWFVHADSVGNFLSEIVLGSNASDEGAVVYPLSNGNVIAGGYYGNNNGSFASLPFYGAEDAFLVELSPFDQTAIPNLDNLDNSLRIYPNPATGNFTLEHVAGAEMVMYDVVGRQVERRKVTTDKEVIDISHLAPGVYLVQVFINGRTERMKLIRE